MKKVLLSFLAMATALALQAQTQVTLRVDMGTLTVDPNGPRVAGNIQAAAGIGTDWTPNPGNDANKMTDMDGDGVYEIVLTVPPGDYQYKFINGNEWGKDEGVPNACATGGNRGITVGATAITQQYCFGRCETDCPTTTDVQVTLRVSLGNDAPSANGVHVAGAFQGWNPGATALTDGDGDGIYEVTLTMQNGTYGYKFLNGNNWGTDEAIPCDCNSGGNREIVVPFTNQPVVMPVVCFRSCDTNCPGGAAEGVTFRVDMSGEALGPGGLFVAGSFQTPLQWQKNVIQLTDPDGNEIYDVTVPIVPGEHEYKFFNGTDGNAGSDTYAEGTGYDFRQNGCGCPSAGFNNRILNINAGGDPLQPVFVYNSCAQTLVGTTDLSTAKNIKLFPNPMGKNAYLEFEGEGKHSVLISDQLGRVVRQYNAAAFVGNQLQIQKGELLSGLYFVTIQNEKGESAVVKLSVQ
jgi:hypothetical protein